MLEEIFTTVALCCRRLLHFCIICVLATYFFILFFSTLFYFAVEMTRKFVEKMENNTSFVLLETPGLLTDKKVTLQSTVLIYYSLHNFDYNIRLIFSSQENYENVVYYIWSFEPYCKLVNMTNFHILKPSAYYQIRAPTHHKKMSDHISSQTIKINDFTIRYSIIFIQCLILQQVFISFFA